MRTRWTVVAGLVAALFASGWAATAATATAPVTLANGFVTDETGELSSSEISAANDRLSALAQDDGGDLYVVLVDSFTDPSDGVQWADDTANDNGLGADQYLIAIAVDDSQYAISADSSGPLSDGQIDHVLQALEDQLRAHDWSGAIIAAADAFPGQSAGSAPGWLGILVVLIVIAVIVLIVVLIVRAQRGKRRQAAAAVPDPNDPYAQVSDDDLEKQAGSALVQADDAITSSRQELGFAIAQFGDDSTAAFTQVVEDAQAKVAEAFSLKQQLDDEIPDSPAQRRAWHIRIVQLCGEADEILAANVDAFEQLRRLEADAPQALERLRARRAAAEQALAGAPAALAALTGTYDQAALATVAANPDQARQRLALADAEIADAAQQIAAGSNGEAAYSIRTGEEAVAQSEQLVAAVTTLGANLAAVEDQARTLIAELESDIVAAGAVPDAQGVLAPLVARTRAHIDAAQADLQRTGRNPQHALDALTAANAEIDQAIGQARDAAVQAQRVQQELSARLTTAQAQISAANDFITTRRGAIGATARTRLAEANAAYADAVAAQATDPVRATERATRAYSLANEALSAARSEVSSFDAGGWGGGYAGGYNNGYSRGGDLGGDILGGILGGLFSGGGGGGGSSWRSSGSGWGGSSHRSSSSSRSSRPSSFGSRGGSRSGGSRGSSRGGRF